MTMTEEERFQDLKQFIEATVSQHMAGVRDELKEDIRGLDAKLDTIHEAVAETVQDHERRIERLEQRAA